MEGPKGSLSDMGELRASILESVYFISSFKSICEEVEKSSEQIRSVLTDLLKEKLIDQMSFDNDLKDYVVINDLDLENLETKNYVVTKLGLLKANERI